jgi:hypothetical protein
MRTATAKSTITAARAGIEGPIAGIELTGFVVTLIATRWRRRRDRLDLPIRSGQKTRTPGLGPLE